MTQESSFSEIVDQATDEMVHKVFEDLQALASPKDPDLVRHSAGVFLAKFLGLLVLVTLEETPEDDMSNEEAYNFATENFASIKAVVQDATAAAFSEALGQYSGIDTDYYCTIAPIPEPSNDWRN